jgi:uncharacterized MAPEG superfamily protein
MERRRGEPHLGAVVIHYLLASSGLTWVMLVVSAILRTGATPSGITLAVGNRDSLQPPSALAARADRAAKNMLENLVLFACVLLAASLANANAARVTLGCQVFLFARVAYALLYLAGVPWLRTVAWLIGVAGMTMIGIAAW